MRVLILALTEGERIAIIGGLLAILGAGVPATIAAVTAWRTSQTANRVRAENTHQHGESQRKLEKLTEAVHGHTGKLDTVVHSIERLDDKHDQLAERLATGELRLSTLEQRDNPKEPSP
jgi:septal ring factor EnvC (AmiA/AmiB activator)